MTTYEIQFDFDGGHEPPLVYITCDGLQVAEVFEEPTCTHPSGWSDDPDDWKPPVRALEILSMLQASEGRTLIIPHEVATGMAGYLAVGVIAAPCVTLPEGAKLVPPREGQERFLVAAHPALDRDPAVWGALAYQLLAAAAQAYGQTGDASPIDRAIHGFMQVMQASRPMEDTSVN